MVLDRVPRACAAHAGLDLVGDEHDAVLGAELAEAAEEAVCRDDDAAVALDRFDEQCSELRRTDVRVDVVDGALGRLFARHALRVAEGIADRHAVQLAGERTHPRALRPGPVGHCHREVRSPVECVVEGCDGSPAGELAGDLHRVLDRLGPRVHEDRVLLEVAGRDLGELLGDADVVLVGRDREECVGQLRRLLRRCSRHLGVRMADGRDADAAAEVDEPVSVDVDQDRAGPAFHVDVRESAGAPADGGDPPLLQGDRSGTGEVGDELAGLRNGEVACHPSIVGRRCFRLVTARSNRGMDRRYQDHYQLGQRPIGQTGCLPSSTSKVIPCAKPSP